MIQLRPLGDDRQLAFCPFCGRQATETRDHCPSRVLLDEPYPENLPVVSACQKCNNGFSADEEYLACLLSCVLAGSADPDDISRPKVARILREKPELRSRFENARIESEHGIQFKVEVPRVIRILTKLAQGHAVYELHEPRPVPPDRVDFVPIGLLSESARLAFECPPAPALWPEMGSRALQRMVMEGTEPIAPWIEVQSGVYRFLAAPGPGMTIRMVIGEYLACAVGWSQ